MNRQWESIISFADNSGMEFSYVSTPSPHIKLYGKELAVLRPISNGWLLKSKSIAISGKKPHDLLDIYAKTFH